MIRTQVGLLSAATSVLIASASQAAVIGSYNFERTPEGTSNTDLTSVDTSDDTEANSTSTFGFGSGLVFNTGTAGSRTGVNDHSTSVGATVGTEGSFAGSFYANAGDTTATTLAGAITNNEYVQFTASPNAGYQLDLSSLSFYIRKSNGDQNNAAYAVRSSVDSYTADLANATIPTGAYPASATSISLSAAQFQGLTSPVTFRFYFFNDGTGGGRYTGIDQVVINGSVAPVPEPAMLGLLGITVLHAGRRRR